MKEAVILEKIEDAIWKNGGSNSNIQPDDLTSAAKAILEVVLSNGFELPMTFVEDERTGKTIQAGRVFER